MTKDSVTRNAALVGAFTGISRILGLFREMLTANLFGTSIVQSAFVVAFTIPNLFRRLFGEGALSAAFVPAFSKSHAQETPSAALSMARRVLTLVGAVLAFMIAAGMAATWIAAPFMEEGGRMAATLPLLRIMLPYALFICLAAMSMGMLNVLGDFRTPAIAPALLNVVWIGVLVGVCPFLPDSMEVRIVAVSFGVFAAGLLQFGYQWIVLRNRGWTLLPERGGWSDPRVKRVWQQALPAAIGAGVVQINVCLDFVLAYWAADWAPSALTYADRILYLPMGVVATAFSTVLLPTFSRQFAENDTAAMRDTFRSSLRNLSLLMVPAAVGLVLLAGPIVSVLYQRGQFDALGTVRTARALACYAPGLFVFSLHKVLNPLFYGMHDTRTPMRVSAAGVLLNLALNLLFVLTWPIEWKHAGIAISTVISSALASLVLALIARRRIGPLGWNVILATALRALLAALLMGVAARWTWDHVLPFLDRFSDLSDGYRRIGALISAMAVAACVYPAGLFLVSPREARRLAEALRRRKMHSMRSK